MTEYDDLEMGKEDVLSDVCADLLGHKNYAIFLERLFDTSSGEWHSLDELCTDLSNLTARLQNSQILMSNVWVTWITHPIADCKEDFCMIIFFSEDPDWRSVAVFNRGLFLRGSHTEH